MSRTPFCRLVILGMVTLFTAGAWGETVSESAPLYDPSPLNFGLDVSFSSAKYTAWQLTPNTAMPGANPGVHVGLEWLSPYPAYGKLGIGVGITAGVHANAVVGQNADGTPRYATLSAFPVEISLSYRLEYLERQPVVPYGRMGTSFTFASQTSKTGGEIPGTHVGYGFDLAFGLEFPLHLIDSATQRTMDNRWGINGTYLVAEIVSSQSLIGVRFPDLSRKEYRLGLRFEI